MAKKKNLRFKTIRQKVLIKAPVEAVFDALIDPKIQSEFTGAKATGKPTKGSEFTAWDGYISGKYLSIKKENKVAMTWLTSEWPDGYPPSKLILTFKDTEMGTWITLVQEKVPAEQANEYSQGWKDFYWQPMKEYFA